jgi:hypothetical protein
MTWQRCGYLAAVSFCLLQLWTAAAVKFDPCSEITGISRVRALVWLEDAYRHNHRRLLTVFVRHVGGPASCRPGLLARRAAVRLGQSSNRTESMQCRGAGKPCKYRRKELANHTDLVWPHGSGVTYMSVLTSSRPGVTAAVLRVCLDIPDRSRNSLQHTDTTASSVVLDGGCRRLLAPCLPLTMSKQTA